MTKALGFYSTYEELKPRKSGDKITAIKRFYSTYEELKLHYFSQKRKF